MAGHRQASLSYRTVATSRYTRYPPIRRIFGSLAIASPKYCSTDGDIYAELVRQTTKDGCMHAVRFLITSRNRLEYVSLRALPWVMHIIYEFEGNQTVHFCMPFPLDHFIFDFRTSEITKTLAYIAQQRRHTHNTRIGTTGRGTNGCFSAAQRAIIIRWSGNNYGNTGKGRHTASVAPPASQ